MVEIKAGTCKVSLVFASDANINLSIILSISAPSVC